MSRLRPTVAEVDLAAIRHNAALLVPPEGALMAVVKADGYGHGAAPVARAALDGGASWLGVALVEEGLGLRDAGVEAPILLLSEPPPGTEAIAIAARLTPTVYTDGALARVADAARGAPVAVHVKVDTGMHRVGVWPPGDAGAFARRVLDAGLDVEGPLDPPGLERGRSGDDRAPARSVPRRGRGRAERGGGAEDRARRQQRRDDPVPRGTVRPRPTRRSPSTACSPLPGWVGTSACARRCGGGPPSAT